jgi:hypothetical protein
MTSKIEKITSWILSHFSFVRWFSSSLVNRFSRAVKRSEKISAFIAMLSSVSLFLLLLRNNNLLQIIEPGGQVTTQVFHTSIIVTLILFDAFLKLVYAFFNLHNELGVLLCRLPAEKAAGAQNADNNDGHACNKLNDFTSREEPLILFDGADSILMRGKTLNINIDVCGDFFLPIVSDLT